MSTNLKTVLNGNELTMSSLEIATLTGKEHKHVIRDIRTMLEELGDGPNLDHVREDKDTRGYTACFNLPKRETIILVSGYNIKMRAAIIDRWQELEQQQATPQINFMNPAEAARAFADMYERKLLAEQQAQEAIRTKAEIGNRREATAMNTASQAVKQVKKLTIELDRSRDYATIKRMSLQYHGIKFSWRILKSACQDLELEPIEIYDANYGTVKAYHRLVWLEAYKLDIDVGGHHADIEDEPKQPINPLAKFESYFFS